MPKAKAYAKESDLCAAFIAAVGKDWTAYAETQGWDILLVRNADGFQIGIQAKLRLIPFVLAQALEEYGAWAADRPGPDCRAVLVPWDEVTSGLPFLCSYVGVTVIRMPPPGKPHPYGGRRNLFDPALPKIDDHYSSEKWFEQCHTKRLKLPEYVPDVPAGVPSPAQLTQWKIKALKLEHIMETRGFVTRADFRHLQLDHRFWTAPGLGKVIPADGRYTPGDGWPRFSKVHPDVYAKIKADAGRWMEKNTEGQGLLALAVK